MSYLLDTCVLSELAKPMPDPNLVAWLGKVSNLDLHISVLTLGEIRKGVEIMPQGARKDRLRAWLENDLPDWFEDRVLPVSLAAADAWGRLLARARRPVPAVDGLLAATAMCGGLALVTRNEADFDFPGLRVLNPWKRIRARR